MKAATASKTNKRVTRETKLIERVLAEGGFAHAEAYRYNSACIRIRVVDPAFRDKSIVEREDLVYPLVEKLPEDTQADITFLLLITPEEREGRRAHLNWEFDDPTPSSL